MYKCTQIQYLSMYYVRITSKHHIVTLEKPNVAALNTQHRQLYALSCCVCVDAYAYAYAYALRACPCCVVSADVTAGTALSRGVSKSWDRISGERNRRRSGETGQTGVSLGLLRTFIALLLLTVVGDGGNNVSEKRSRGRAGSPTFP